MATDAGNSRGSGPGMGGVIHDLGYRHYSGSRAGSGAITRALFVDSLRGAFGVGRTTRAKVMPLLLLVCAVTPAVIVAIVVGVVGLRELPGEYTDYSLKISALVSLFVAGQAPAGVSRDLRFRVVALYFSRPLLRVQYVLAKYAALVAATFLMMAIPLTTMYVGALLAKLSVASQTPDFLRSLGGAAVTAALVAGIGLAIAALTPRRGLGVAAIIVTLTVLTGLAGAVAGIAEENGAEDGAAYAWLISPFFLAHGVQSSLFGATNSLAVPPSGAVQGAVFIATAALIVAGSLGALLARYRRVSI